MQPIKNILLLVVALSIASLSHSNSKEIIEGVKINFVTGMFSQLFPPVTRNAVNIYKIALNPFFELKYDLAFYAGVSTTAILQGVIIYVIYRGIKAIVRRES